MYYRLLRLLPSSLPSSSSSSSLTSLISRVETSTSEISTDLGRGRAAVMLALNEQNLTNFFSTLLWREEIMKEWYKETAILRDEDQKTEFLCMKNISFLYLL